LKPIDQQTLQTITTIPTAAGTGSIVQIIGLLHRAACSVARSDAAAAVADTRVFRPASSVSHYPISQALISGTCNAKRFKVFSYHYANKKNFISGEA